MDFITLGSFVFFTSLVGFITYCLTRKDDHQSSVGYFLAGRKLTGGFIAGSLMLTNLSTEQLVGLNGSAFSDGMSVMAWEVISALSIVAMGLFFLPRYLRSGITTIPELLEIRFSQSTRFVTTLIFLAAYTCILLPILLYTGAVGLSGILDVRSLLSIEDEKTVLWLVVWFVGILGSIYAIFGGLRTVAVSDTINGFGLLVGGVLITILGLQVVGDGQGLAFGWHTLREANPEKFNSIGGPGQMEYTGWQDENQTWVSTTDVTKDVNGQTLRKSDRAALTSIKVAADEVEKTGDSFVLAEDHNIRIESRKISVPFPTLFTGVILLTTFYWCTNQQIIQRTLGASSLAEGQRGVLFASFLKILAPIILVIPGIIAFHLYASDGIKPDQAYGTLVRDVLPTWLRGFFAAVMVGAILSSFNSVLNSTATLFSLGIYKAHIRRDASQTEVIRSGKVCGMVLAIIAMSTAPLLAGQDSIFGYMQKMNAMYATPILSVVLIGLTTRYVPGRAATTALIVGCAAVGAGYFVPLGPITNQIEQMGDFHFIAIVFVSLLGIMLIWGMLQPRTEPFEQTYTGDVDMTPWRWAWPMALLIIVSVLSIDAYFADFSVLTQ